MRNGSPLGTLGTLAVGGTGSGFFTATHVECGHLQVKRQFELRGLVQAAAWSEACSVEQFYQGAIEKAELFS